MDEMNYQAFWKFIKLLHDTPEAFTVHKIIINGQRGSKSEKDIRAIENILPYISEEKLDEIISNLTKKEKKAYDEYMKR